MASQSQVIEKPAVPMMRKVRHIHFVGIGGAGMNGIAEVLMNQGYRVSGSDLQPSLVTERLSAHGASIVYGHAPSHVSHADVVVVSTAIAEDNPEIVSAREQSIPIVPRAEMLAELMRFRHGIAVAGTHGKTTTTSLVASILAEGELDPTYVIGGRLNSSGTNARLGTGQYLVVEADESDASFLHLKPMISIVTNIEADHLATYGGDFSQLTEVFIQFLHHLPFYGLAVLCRDCPVVSSVLPRISRPVKTYGLHQASDICATSVSQKEMTTTFECIVKPQNKAFDVTLNLPGEHNVQNALAAISVGLELGVSVESIQSALNKFAGIGRRIQPMGAFDLSTGQITMFDDYGHHPSEIAATIKALKTSWPERRLVMIFQPHRFSRTRDLFDDFTKVLSTVDELFLLGVYSAGESPIQGADSRSLARGIRQRGQVEPIVIETDEDPMAELMQTLPNILKPGDILITQGAGNIGRLATELQKRLSE